jgi:hypothetical protein
MDFNGIRVTGTKFELPELTQAEIDALSLTASDAGRQLFNTDTGTVQTWNGTVWLSGGVASIDTSVSINLDGKTSIIYAKQTGPITITGPLTPLKDMIFEIIDTNGVCGTHPITFDGNGKSIRGLSTWILDNNWYVLKIRYNGTEYNIV